MKNFTPYIYLFAFTLSAFGEDLPFDQKIKFKCKTCNINSQTNNNEWKIQKIDKETTKHLTNNWKIGKINPSIVELAIKNSQNKYK